MDQPESKQMELRRLQSASWSTFFHNSIWLIKKGGLFQIVRLQMSWIGQIIKKRVRRSSMDFSKYAFIKKRVWGQVSE